MLEVLRALFGLFRSRPADSQEHARLLNGSPQWQAHGGASTYAEQFRPGSYPGTGLQNHFNGHLYMTPGPPPPFYDAFQQGLRPNYHFQAPQVQQPFQPPIYPPPNYPPPNHPFSSVPVQQQVNSGPMSTFQRVHGGPTAEREGAGEDSPDGFNYPTGSVRREAVSGTEESRWNYSKWVWRSVGKSSHNGRSVETRACMGALTCLECGRVTRPLTQADSRKKQITRGCTFATCPSDGPLQHQICKARTYHYKVARDGTEYHIWEHEGEHDTHARPPGGALSQSEQAQLDDQLRRRQTASVHQLRTGDTGPGSVPLADISPALANARSARYHMSQSQARIGLPPSTSAKGGLAFFKSLSALRTKLSTTFIVDSSLNGPAYISFQTPFMDSLIKEAVEAWIADFAEGPEAGRHGFVTDGDMTFFRHGPLLASCVFSGGFTKWVPVLYTWIDQQDTAHHRAHFRCLFHSVIKYAGPRFHPELLLNVMDFSAAQRAAHAEEFADAIIGTMQPAFSQLNPAAQDLQRKLLVEEAQAAQVGCDLHFARSAVRLKKNGALVPPELLDTFDSALRRMLSKNTTREGFAETVTMLKTTFPRIGGWANWWLRPTIASMIFPALSVVDPESADKVPSNTNPIEHQHSLLHHATGTDMDLVQGAENIWLHVRELEKQYDAIKGHFNAVTPRTYRPPRPQEWEPNDGRAPDTVAALDLLTPGTHQGHKRLLQSYPWQQPNSCFFDNGLEHWFRIWLLWDQSTRKMFLKQLPSDSILAAIFYHYERRREWIYGYSGNQSMRAGLNELELAQRVVRHAIFSKWQLYGRPDEYGCCRTWLTHAITDGGTAEKVHLFFGRRHSWKAICGSGHETVKAIGRPQTFVAISPFDLLDLREKNGSNCTWSDYLASTVPRVSGGNSGSTPVHEVAWPLLCSDCNCPHSSDESPINPQEAFIETSWPQILHITPDAGVQDRLPNSHTISFPTVEGRVEYTLIGTVSHRNSHWTSKIRIDSQTFRYDDLNNGRRRSVKQQSIFHLGETSFVLVTRL
ncbi:hypothetical protein K438DRAFT_2082802 [Mycena galopus ATCC 62051]|nr:hypothetical protein K438DRAFT_2082802 [Mycena galopus ATCC 62051]